MYFYLYSLVYFVFFVSFSSEYMLFIKRYFNIQTIIFTIHIKLSHNALLRNTNYSTPCFRSILLGLQN